MVTVRLLLVAVIDDDYELLVVLAPLGARALIVITLAIAIASFVERFYVIAAMDCGGLVLKHGYCFAIDGR